MRIILALLAILVTGFVFLVAIGLSLLNGILRFFGLAPKSNPFLDNGASDGVSGHGAPSGFSGNSGNADAQGSPQPRFSDDEGEYIDFEEV